MMKLSKNQLGMSLIEVMVAVSILSVIMVSVMMLGKNMDKSAKNAEKKGDIQSYVAEINQLLADKASCSASFYKALGAASSKTYITSLKTVNGDGNLVAHPRLRISAVNTGDNRNAVVINGMHLENVATNAGAPDTYQLVVTFVKNPRAAGGNATSDANTMQNYVVKKIPVAIDNCQRTIAWSVDSTNPTCDSGVAVGGVLSVTSAGGAQTGFKMQVCRNCAAGKPEVAGCI